MIPLLAGLLFARAPEGVQADNAYRALTQCRVTIDGEAASLGTVYVSEDDMLLPAARVVQAVSHGLATLERKNAQESDVMLDGSPVIRVMDLKDETYAQIRLPGGTTRKVSLPDGFEEQDDHLLVNAHLLGYLFGDTVTTGGNAVDIRTPAYWEARLGVTPSSTEPRRKARWLASLKYLPDFGITPPAKVLAMWVRPDQAVRCQIYDVSGIEPRPMLRVRKLGDQIQRVVDGGPGDPLYQWRLEPNRTTLAQEEFAPESQPKEAAFVAVLSRDLIGNGNPYESITSDNPPPDSDWAIYGVRQTIGPTSIALQYDKVQPGDTFASVAKRWKMAESVLRALNGMADEDKLDPEVGRLVVMSRETSPIVEHPRPYEFDGLYCAKPGDTVEKLAAAWGVSVEEFSDANPDLVAGAEIGDQELLDKIRPKAKPPSPHPIVPIADPRFLTLRELTLHTDGSETSTPCGAVPRGVVVAVDGVAKGTDYYVVSYGNLRGFVHATPDALKHLVSRSPSAPPPGPATLIAATSDPIIREAASHIGLPYAWGGGSLKSGIDCSHFVAAVLGRVGDGAPRTPVTNQENCGQLVHYKSVNMPARRFRRTIYPSRDNPRASDDLNRLGVGDRFIVQYKLNDAPKTRHTGLYIGHVRWRGHDYAHAVIHASCTPGVTISEIDHSFIWKNYKYSVRGSARVEH